MQGPGWEGNMRKSQFAVFADYHETTLALNTLTYEFLRINRPFEIVLQEIEADALPDDVLAALVKGRFLIADTDDEYAEFLVDYRQKRYGPQRVVLYVSPTLACNASCEYCFQRDIRPAGSDGDGPDIKALLQFAASKLHDAEGLQVTWFGGEPLLRRRYIRRASGALMQLAELAGKPYSSSMVTNALLMSAEAIDVLREAHITRLQISLDGTEALHNAIGRRDRRHGYRDIVENMQQIPDDILIAIRINVSAINVRSLIDLIDDLADSGLNRPNVWLDLPLVYDFSIDNALTEYRNAQGYCLPNRDYGPIQLALLAYAADQGFKVETRDLLIPGASQCHAIRSKGYSIWPDGAVTRCIHEVSTPEGINITDSRLDINHAVSQQKYLTTEIFENTACRGCFFLPMCGGSCLHGRFFGLNPPYSCPPSKLTLPDRMRWYEAIASGDECPIRHDREYLQSSLDSLADSMDVLGPPPSTKKERVFLGIPTVR
jgi:uncharacterized protein